MTIERLDPTRSDLPDDTPAAVHAQIERVRRALCDAALTAGHDPGRVDAYVDAALAAALTDLSDASVHAYLGILAERAARLPTSSKPLSTITAAVAEGRRVFDNVRRFVCYGLAGGLAELVVMLLGPFLGLPLPLLAAQILWVNLLTHGLPGVAFGAEQPEADVLRRPPRPPTEGVLNRRDWWEVLMLCATIAASCLVLACWLAARHRGWQTRYSSHSRRDSSAWRSPCAPNNVRCGARRQPATGSSTWRVQARSPSRPRSGSPRSPVCSALPAAPADVGWALAAGSVPAVLVEIVKAWRRRAAKAEPVGPAFRLRWIRLPYDGDGAPGVV
jgi:Ca2+-transporting ATPase